MTSKKIRLQPETKLERHVAKWLKFQAAAGGYESGIEGNEGLERAKQEVIKRTPH